MSIDFHLADHPSQNRLIIAREVIDEFVLVNIDQPDQAVFLNPIASRIWGMLNGQRTLADIAVTIAAEYGASADEVQSDVIAFMWQLDRIGAVVNEKGSLPR